MDEAGQDRPDELTLDPVTVGSPRRRRALWGVLAAVAVAAGALTVVSAGDDDSPPARLPVALGASGMEATGAADAMLRAVTYVPGDDLPALGGTAAAYRLSGAVDEAAVVRLARALGLDGAPSRDGSTWRVATQDGGHLEVTEGYGAMWWYSATGGGVTSGSSGPGGVDACAESSDDVVVDCAVRPTTTVVVDPTCADEAGATECTTGTCGDTGPCPGPMEPECPPNASCAITCVTAEPGTSCAEPPPVCGEGGPADDTGCFPPDCAVSSDGTTSCPEPTPAADLPTEDEARQIALDLLASAGMGTDDAIVRADGPYEAWYISVEPRVAGLPSGLYASVSVGPNGEVRDASGFLGDIEKVGDYPLLDTRAAIERANQQQVMPMMAATDDLAPAPGEPGTRSSYGGGAPDSGAAVDPVCTDEDLAADRCGDQLVDPPATTVPCKVQPDGREICEVPTPPVPEPAPVPEPEPFEVVLVDVEPALALLGANDGSTDAYLLPAYRFTAEDGSTVDLPAVADEALAPTPEPPATDPPITPIYPQQCDLLIEEDGAGSTHTVQPSPDCVSPDPIELPTGEQPAVGVGYYVDVQVLDGHCTWISAEVGGRWWWAEMPPGSLSEWSTPTEGGTFTLLDADTAQFVGDAARTKTALLTPFGDGTERPLCD